MVPVHGTKYEEIHQAIMEECARYATDGLTDWKTDGLIDWAGSYIPQCHYCRVGNNKIWKGRFALE